MMKSRVAVFGAAVSLALLGPLGSTASASTTMERVFAFRFLPQTLTVPHGTKVVFANTDAVPVHTMTEGEGETSKPLFDSGVVNRGSQKTVRGVDRLEPGTYPFHCQIHDFMHGTLVVT